LNEPGNKYGISESPDFGSRLNILPIFPVVTNDPPGVIDGDDQLWERRKDGLVWDFLGYCLSLEFSQTTIEEAKTPFETKISSHHRLMPICHMLRVAESFEGEGTGKSGKTVPSA